MSYNVTTDEVRYRLVTLTSADVSDTVINSAAFLPVADAWLNDKLGIDSVSADLTGNEAAFAKAAEIAYCCALIVASAPVRGAKAGPVEIKPITAGEKAEIVKILQSEYNRYLTLLGADLDDEFAGGFYVESTGGDDYMPDGSDDSSIDFADEENEFNVFS